MLSSLPLVATTVIAAFMAGMINVLFTSLQQPLSQRLRVEPDKAAGLGRWLQLSFIPMLLASGLLLDRWGDKVILFTGIVTFAVGLTGLGLCRRYLSAVFAALVLGAAGACVLVSVTYLMPHAFIFEQNPVPAATNLGFVFVGIASFATPGVFAVLCKRLDLRQALLTVGLICLLPATLIAFAQDFPPAAGNFDPNELVRDARLWVAAALILLYLPFERSLGIWTARYLSDMGYDEKSKPFWIRGFWIAFLGTRLLMPFALQYILPNYEIWLVLFLIGVSAVTVGNLAELYGTASGGRGLFLLGVCHGPIYPTILGITMTMFSDAPATSIGIVMCLGAIGSLIFQPILVGFAKDRAAKFALRIPMVLVLLTAFTTLVLALIREI